MSVRSAHLWLISPCLLAPSLTNCSTVDPPSDEGLGGSSLKAQTGGRDSGESIGGNFPGPILGGRDPGTSPRPGEGGLGGSLMGGAGPSDPLCDTGGPECQAKQLALGDSHSCALFADDQVRCWGSDSVGQIGNGSSTLSPRYAPAVTAPLRDSPVAIGSGADHVCAVMQGGAIQCWGGNEFGQLGDGTQVNGFEPVSVVGLGGPAVRVDGGDKHTCAVLEDGSVECWGDNEYGQLGREAGSVSSSLTPLSVVGLSSIVTQVAVGDRHVCALLDDGGVMCWGANEESQLGGGPDLDLDENHLPVAVVGLSGMATAVAVGLEFSCALVENATVECWGYDFGGEATPASRHEGTYSEIHHQSSTTCALSSDSRTIECTEEDEEDWTIVGLDGGVQHFALGERHGCAILLGGTLKCWGWNSDAQLGNGEIGGGTGVTAVNVIASDEEPFVWDSVAGEDVLRGSDWNKGPFTDSYHFGASVDAEVDVLDRINATSSRSDFESESFPFSYFIGASRSDGLTEITTLYDWQTVPTFGVFKIDVLDDQECLYFSDTSVQRADRPTELNSLCWMRE